MVTIFKNKVMDSVDTTSDIKLVRSDLNRHCREKKRHEIGQPLKGLIA